MTAESKFVFLARDDRFVGTYRADAATGRVARWSYAANLDAVRWGRAARCGGRMTSILKRPDDEHIVLCRGRRSIDLDESRGQSPHVRLRRFALFSILSIRLQDCTFRAWNFTPGRMFGFIDPTWDGLDDDAEDFLIGVARLVRDVGALERLRDVWPFTHHEGGRVSLHVE